MVNGVVLGSASSKTVKHRHPEGQTPPPYQRCSACRWTELTLLRLPNGKYATLSEGHSDIEGEMTYRKVRKFTAIDKLVASLYREDFRCEDSAPVLSVVARKALVSAAPNDRDLETVLRSQGILG